MSIRAKLELAAGLLAAIAGVAGFRTWLAERDLRIRAEAETSAEKKVFDEARTEIEKLTEADRQRDASATAAIAAVQATAAKQTTPAEIAAFLSRNQALPQPIIVQTSAPAEKSPENGSPGPSVTIPGPDLAPMRDYTEKCESCGISLAAAKGDLASKAEELRLAGEQLSAVEGERDAWKTAAKGGTAWQRFKRAAKWITIGVAVGAAAVCGSHHCR